jgi:phi LC3 family holin
MGIAWRQRLKNKYWWIAIISLLVLLAKQCGFDLLVYVPKNYSEIITSIFLIIGMLGVSVDTSTTGIPDIVPPATVDFIQNIVPPKAETNIIKDVIAETTEQK